VSPSAEFWDWAVAAYARPGVQPLLLGLQDAHGQSVPFLLWGGWLEVSGRSPPRAVLAEAAALAGQWESAVIGPLRGVRRHLQGAGADPLRRQVEAAELEAERALMEALAALAPPPKPSKGGVDALSLAASHWKPPPSPQALKLLARVLG
jgi:uncharacterized protein (TIGR02444 family)